MAFFLHSYWISKFQRSNWLFCKKKILDRGRIIKKQQQLPHQPWWWWNSIIPKLRKCKKPQFPICERVKHGDGEWDSWKKKRKKRRSRLDFHPHPFIFLPNSGLNVSCCSIGTVSDADNGNNSFHQMVIFSGCWTFTKDSFSANSWPKIFAIHCCEQHLFSYLPLLISMRDLEAETPPTKTLSKILDMQLGCRVDFG